MNRPPKQLVALSSVSLLLGSQILALSPPPAQAQTVVGNVGCPAGTVEGPVNLIINGNFSTNAGIPGPVARFLVPPGLGFTSDLPYRGDFAYPSDGNPGALPAPPANNGGGLSIQNGAVPGVPGVVTGRGVNAAEVARAGITPANPINTYLYSNPFLDNAGNSTFPTPPGPVIWRQTLNVRPNTYYNFKALFFNLINQPGFSTPLIGLEAGNAPPQTPFPVGDGVTPVPGFPNIQNLLDQWVPVQFSFRSDNLNSIQLRIRDLRRNINGDDFGVTAIGLRECLPTIGVSKAAGTPVPNGNGTFTVPYTVTVRNFAPGPPPGGPEFDLVNLQLADNLATTFADATAFSIQAGSIASQTLTVNPNFNGTNNNNLIQGTDTLLAGTSATVTFNVILTPGTGPNGFGTFFNQVAATASSRGGTPINARSNNGANPDLNGDGRPDPPSPTPVELPRGTGGGGDPRFLLVKRITGITRGGATLSGINFSTFVDDPGTSDDNAPGWSQLSTVGIIDLDATNPLRSGDEVTYTVYYLSNGGSLVSAATVCDPIPNGTQYVANTAQVKRATAAFVPSGAFFPPLAPLPANNSCTSQTNTNGTLIFDVGDVPNTTGSNFGFVRFRVRIN
ncbi:MAG: hypothetical protein WCA35_25720 [Kovacikia sp.]